MWKIEYFADRFREMFIEKGPKVLIIKCSVCGDTIEFTAAEGIEFIESQGTGPFICPECVV